MKICRICQVDLPLESYHKDKTKSFGVTGICKNCYSIWSKTNHKITYVPKPKREKVCGSYYSRNPERVKLRVKLYKKEHREQYNKYYYKWDKLKRETDPLYALAKNIRRSINYSLSSKGFRKETNTFKFLGFESEDLSKHLCNYIGKPCELCKEVVIDFNTKNFNIDHILPIGAAKTLEDIKNLNQLSNLRLVCTRCNNIKAKKDKEYIKELK